MGLESGQKPCRWSEHPIKAQENVYEINIGAGHGQCKEAADEILECSTIGNNPCPLLGPRSDHGTWLSCLARRRLYIVWRMNTHFDSRPRIFCRSRDFEREGRWVRRARPISSIVGLGAVLGIAICRTCSSSGFYRIALGSMVPSSPALKLRSGSCMFVLRILGRDRCSRGGQWLCYCPCAWSMTLWRAGPACRLSEADTSLERASNKQGSTGVLRFEWSQDTDHARWDLSTPNQSSQMLARVY